jgi:ATP-binding cassette subfamily F protein 3
MHDIEHRLGDASVPEAEHEAMLSRYAELQDRFRLSDGYNMDLRIATVLRGLGFSPEDAERPCETFSGGWQMRIALAKLLLGRPNLLLLDEPTNHLDLEARNWLEEYLSAYPYAVILVSHDRYFLDTVVTRITDLNLRKLTDYVGNYSKYVDQRDAMLERLRQAKREQDEEVARVKMFIDRFRYQATKAAQVQSRIKLLEKVVPIEVPPERKRIHFTFPKCSKSGRTVFEVKHARKAYGDLTVFKDVNLHIERGDRIALVGPNGAGKSTLVSLLTHHDRALAPGDGQPAVRVLGQSRWNVFELRAQLGIVSASAHHRFVSGNSAGQMTGGEVVLSGFFATHGFLRPDAVTGDMQARASAILERFEASHLAAKLMNEMSTGEARRILIARALVTSPRALVLDEPTEGLDIVSRSRFLDLVERIAADGTTLVVVTHHVEELVPAVQHVILLKEGRVAAAGPKREMITAGQLTAVFGAPISVTEVDGRYFARA